MTAAEKGLIGNAIYLQDGTCVDDNDCISYYAKEKQIFVIYNIDPTTLKDVQLITIGEDGDANILVNNPDDVKVNIAGTIDDYTDEVMEDMVMDEIVMDEMVMEEIVIVDNRKSVKVEGTKKTEENKKKEENPDDMGKNKKSDLENIDLLKSVCSFPIPISIFGLKVQAKINSNVRLQNSEKSEIIQKVVEQMQKTYGSNITLFTIQAVAFKLHSLYPILNQVDDEGNVIGEGNYTTIRQIKDRIYYLNSQYTSSSSEKKKRPTSKSGISLKNKSAGCTNYKPNLQMSNQEYLKIKTWLKDEFKKVEKHRDNSKISQYLVDTYANQRSFILDPTPKPISTIVNELPFLFEPKYLIQHFQTLCSLKYKSIDLKTRFEKIYKFLKDGDELAAGANDNDLVKETLDLLNGYFKIKKGAENFFSLLEVARF